MISLNPSYGSMLGGTGVIITGEDFTVSQGDVIVCLFDGVGVRGVYIDSQQVLCVSPLLERTGKLEFKLNISGSNSGESVFTSRKFFVLSQPSPSAQHVLCMILAIVPRHPKSCVCRGHYVCIFFPTQKT